MDMPVLSHSLGYVSPGPALPQGSRAGPGGPGLSSGRLCPASTVSEAVMHVASPRPRALVSLQLSMPLSTRAWQKGSTSPSFPH